MCCECKHETGLRETDGLVSSVTDLLPQCNYNSVFTSSSVPHPFLCRTLFHKRNKRARFTSRLAIGLAFILFYFEEEEKKMF